MWSGVKKSLTLEVDNFRIDYRYTIMPRVNKTH